MGFFIYLCTKFKKGTFTMNLEREKRKSHVVMRTCINCGQQWPVREKQRRNTVRKSALQLLCPECLESLSMQERQRLYRINSGKYHEEIRTCLCCGKQWKVEVRNDGNKSTDRTRMFCNDCKNLSQTEKKRIMRERIPNYHELEKQRKRESNRRNFIHTMVKHAKDRALKYGYDFDLDESKIVIPDVCPILEVPFEFGTKSNYEYTPSIDRIDNSKGYTMDNIQIISKKANSMKNSATIEELKKFCKNILRYSLNSRENEPAEQEDKEPLG